MLWLRSLVVACEHCTGTRSSQQLSPAMKCMGKGHFTGNASPLLGSGSLTYVNLSATPSNHLWLADFFPYLKSTSGHFCSDKITLLALVVFYFFIFFPRQC